MLTLVLGGARSGKSRYARSLASEHAGEVVFVATATAGDEEMARRIARHRDERPPQWRTIEAPVDLVSALRAAPSDALVLVDCVTIWLSNLLERHGALQVEERERRILDDVERFAAAARERTVVAVSNEVGEGIVPATPLGREFRDVCGLANQALAAEADRVVLVVAGLPVLVKGASAGRT